MCPGVGRGGGACTFLRILVVENCWLVSRLTDKLDSCLFLLGIVYVPDDAVLIYMKTWSTLRGSPQLERPLFVVDARIYRIVGRPREVFGNNVVSLRYHQNSRPLQNRGQGVPRNYLVEAEEPQELLLAASPGHLDIRHQWI